MGLGTEMFMFKWPRAPKFRVYVRGSEAPFTERLLSLGLLFACCLLFLRAISSVGVGAWLEGLQVYTVRSVGFE